MYKYLILIILILPALSCAASQANENNFVRDDTSIDVNFTTKPLAANQNYADLSEEEKQARQERSKRRIRYSSIILLVGSIGSISFYFFSVMRKRK